MLSLEEEEILFKFKEQYLLQQVESFALEHLHTLIYYKKNLSHILCSMLCSITFLDLGWQTIGKSVLFCALRVFKCYQDCYPGAEVYCANQTCSTPSQA